VFFAPKITSQKDETFIIVLHMHARLHLLNEEAADMKFPPVFNNPTIQSRESE
jgi:hypothetical protein